MEQGEDKITRRDVDSLSTWILINLGIINTAALGAVFASETETITATPFAIGLTSALLSQIMWYLISILEYVYGDFLVFNDKISNGIWAFMIFFLVVGTGCLSTACVVYGCFIIMGSSNALLWAIGICGTPFFSLFYILMRKNPECITGGKTT